MDPGSSTVEIFRGNHSALADLLTKEVDCLDVALRNDILNLLNIVEGAFLPAPKFSKIMREDVTSDELDVNSAFELNNF